MKMDLIEHNLQKKQFMHENQPFPTVQLKIQVSQERLPVAPVAPVKGPAGGKNGFYR